MPALQLSIGGPASALRRWSGKGRSWDSSVFTPNSSNPDKRAEMNQAAIHRGLTVLIDPGVILAPSRSDPSVEVGGVVPNCPIRRSDVTRPFADAAHLVERGL